MDKQVERVLYRDERVEIRGVVVGPLDNNVLVVRCRETGEAVLVDAADEHDLLLDLCRRLGVTRVVETHGHGDHIGAVPALREAGYEVAIAEADAAMLAAFDPDWPRAVIGDGDVVDVGRVRLRTIHTPGHTPGSLCFAVEAAPVLLSGDTLFPGGPGTTRFPYSSFEAIIDSIDTRLFNMDPETLVLPGHGASTTIARERPQLAEWIARGW